MLKISTLAAAVALVFSTATYAQTTSTQTVSSKGESQYLTRISPRFSSLAGSDTNMQSLVRGLRSGSGVTLTGPGSVPGTVDTLSFTPTTRPMGYGNITRSLDLANRQLAAAGITNPTPQQLNAALNGGTVTNAAGTTTTLSGVLALRSQGMGWGKIAQTIGVHPGMGKMPATTAASTASTAVTTSTHSSVTTAAGTTTSSAVSASGHGNGITTAGGAISAHGHGNSASASVGQGIVTGAGATAGAGVTSAAGGSQGRGNAYGRSGKP